MQNQKLTLSYMLPAIENFIIINNICPIIIAVRAKFPLTNIMKKE